MARFLLMFVLLLGLPLSAVAQSFALKQHLVERLIADIESNNHQLVTLRLPDIQALSNTAQQAYDNNQLEKAASDQDKVMKSLLALRKAIKGEATTAIRRQDFEQLLEATHSYLETLKRTSETSAEKPRNFDFSATEHMLAKSQKLYQLADIQAAYDTLVKAHDPIVQQLGELLDKQELVVALNLNTPQDVYDYELRTFQSFEMLVRRRQDMVSNESQTRLLNKFSNEAVALRAQALQLYEQGQIKEAALQLESSNQALKRALRVTGIFVP